MGSEKEMRCKESLLFCFGVFSLFVFVLVGFLGFGFGFFGTFHHRFGNPRGEE